MVETAVIQRHTNRRQPDGRAARTERTNAAVVEALLALIEEGDLRPSAQRIAERADVSLRTVFHHFEDLESLYATAAARQITRVMALTRPVDPSLPADARVVAFAAGRARQHEAIAPVRRAALLSEPFSGVLHRHLTWARMRDRDETARVFAPELVARAAGDRREVLEAMTAAASWSAWESLRAHQGLSVVQGRRVMRRMLSALLSQHHR